MWGLGPELVLGRNRSPLIRSTALCSMDSHIEACMRRAGLFSRRPSQSILILSPSSCASVSLRSHAPPFQPNPFAMLLLFTPARFTGEP